MGSVGTRRVVAAEVPIRVSVRRKPEESSWAYLVVDAAIVGRDVVRVEKEAFLKALEAGHWCRHFDTASEEAR